MEAAQAKLITIQQEIDNNGYMDDNFTCEIDVQVEIDASLDAYTSILRKRARVTWLKDGDINTSFFHKMAKIKESKFVISSLHVDDKWITDTSTI